jgi:hypothetical protein
MSSCLRRKLMDRVEVKGVRVLLHVLEQNKKQMRGTGGLIYT